MHVPYIEQDCTVEHDGRRFTAGGALVTSGSVVAYIGDPLHEGATRRALTDWHGNKIGTVELGQGWPVRSYVTSRMYQAYATVEGVTYTGRTAGAGMVFFGKRCAKQRR